jgi:hypothetical protein
MRFSEARAILAGPLQFGDEEQIAAKLFLEDVNEAREKIAHCKKCVATGVNRDGKPCPYCAAHFALEVLAALGVYADEMPP